MGGIGQDWLSDGSEYETRGYCDGWLFAKLGCFSLSLSFLTTCLFDVFLKMTSAGCHLVGWLVLLGCMLIWYRDGQYSD